MKKIVATASALLVTLFTFAAFAQESAGAAANAFDAQTGAAVGAGLAIGLGALGTGIGQGRVAAAALEGIARNPGAEGKIGGRMILGLAFIESIALYSFVMSYVLAGKIH